MKPSDFIHPEDAMALKVLKKLDEHCQRVYDKMHKISYI